MKLDCNRTHLHTHQFGGMQGSKVQFRPETIATKEREPSKKPEGGANSIENGCVFKTQREVNFIMAASAGAVVNGYRVPTEHKATSSRAVRPLHADLSILLKCMS